MTCQRFLKMILSVAACINIVIQVHRGCAAVPRLQPPLRDLLFGAKMLPLLLQSLVLRHL